ncbi:Pup--protein ligase [Corynebacterium sp. ES2775-CONJ]|uniref:Pup--protein ligase n=1 Tax=Corynebacterium sp. ES2775-CONJ TaxID=2974029 RepID=UPI002167B5CC|nr:Pup--protein ligase [Corynebacterium sp. ES2775-CONJ]MCS4489343.1 Pup--protein ligase [Corynebacterium sp. ES2775-CONJ]
MFSRRIVGIETEYGINSVSADVRQPRLDVDEIARLLFRPVMDQWKSSNVFIPNGSRLYLDVGSHPEVATAECDSLSQLISYERAGDKIVDSLASQAERALAEEGRPHRIYLFKNNLDSFGNSYGCHENYLVARETVLRHLGRSFLPFLITRQLICGAGSIQEGSFQLSQRADHVWEGVSSATTRSRPIINTRDEPHADSHHYRRLHVIVGDSNMAEPSLALKVGSTTLVLEMLEAGIEFPRLASEKDISVIREISRDCTGRAVVPCEKGPSMSALDIQWRYLEAAQKWLEHRDDNNSTPNSELVKVCHLWRLVLEAIESTDYSLVEHDIDWIIKLQLLRRYQRRLGLSSTDFSHPKLKQVELTYHDIRNERGLHRIMESKGLIHRWIDPRLVDIAQVHPPHTTRAHLRGRFIQAARDHGVEFSADWMRLKVNGSEPHSVELGCPFSPHDTRVDELIEIMRREGRE